MGKRGGEVSVVRSVVIAFSMFSRIPMPRVQWEGRSMRYTMAAFPLVGVLVGAVVLGWDMLCLWLGLGDFLRGAGIALLPVLLTGGIHLDGFCDTVDALASHAESEKKQAILADSHIGAFAAIGVAAYLLGLAAVASQSANGLRPALCIGLLFILSRSLSGLAVVFFKPARDSGLARTFADAAARRATGIVLFVFLAASAALLFFLGGLGGLAALVAAGIVLLAYRHVAMSQFGGISGDLAGWFLQLCELSSLGALVLVQRLLVTLS